MEVGGKKSELAAFILSLYLVFVLVGWPLLFYHNLVEVDETEDRLRSLQARLAILESA